MPIELPHLTGQASYAVEQAIQRLRDGIEEYHAKIQQRIDRLPVPLTLDEIQAALGPSGSHPLPTASLLNTVPPPSNPAPPPPVNPPIPPSVGVLIDGYSVSIYNSPDVSGWSETTTLTAIDLNTTGVHLTFSAQATWPDTPNAFGPATGALQYTLWIFLKISGQWYAAGVIQFYLGLSENGGNVTFNNQIATNWVYDSRWGPMNGYQPSAGETVGFMVSQGNARGVDIKSVAERSPIAWVTWPPTTPQSYPPFATPP